MLCRITDLRYKEVVNVNNGCCLGPVSDVEIDTCCAKVQSIVIFGRPKCFGLMGRDEDTVISWENIQCIGEDTILVRHKEQTCRSKRPQSVFEKIFG